MPLNWAALSTYGLPLIVFIGFWYLMILRPQQTQEKKRREMLGALKNGNKIVTIGGMYGVISEIKKDTVIVKVDGKVEIEFQKSAISQVRTD